MSDAMIEKIMGEVMQKMAKEAPAAVAPAKKCNITEFVGTAIGHTIGIVIANVDQQLLDKMKVKKRYHSIGILSARVGAGPQIFAADEAIKATNSEIISIELARDTEGGAGHGSLILFGADEVSDARRAVEVALNDINRTMGDVYGSPAGHLEFQYSVGAPAGIGVIMADTAVKAATVNMIAYSSPANGTCFSNEVIGAFSGDSGAVLQAIIAARDVGLQLMSTLDPAPIQSTTTPYIK